MPVTPLRDQPQTPVEIHRAMFERAYNILVPRSAVRAEFLPYGVRYLHPTKGYRTVGKRRFAIRGVM